MSLFFGKSFSDIKGNNLQEEVELNMNEKIMLNQLQLIGVDSKSLKTENIKRDGLIIIDNIDVSANKKLINALPLGFNDKGKIDNIHKVVFQKATKEKYINLLMKKNYITH